MDFNKLIEDSFSMLYGSAQRPNLNMLYSAKTDTFSEGFIWDGCWIQNSYGFTLGAVPFFGGLWRDILQRSYDEHGLREMTSVKKDEIVKLYDNAVVQLWEGFTKTNHEIQKYN